MAQADLWLFPWNVSAANTGLGSIAEKFLDSQGRDMVWWLCSRLFELYELRCYQIWLGSHDVIYMARLWLNLLQHKRPGLMACCVGLSSRIKPLKGCRSRLRNMPPLGPRSSPRPKMLWRFSQGMKQEIRKIGMPLLQPEHVISVTKLRCRPRRCPPLLRVSPCLRLRPVRPCLLPLLRLWGQFRLCFHHLRRRS